LKINYNAKILIQCVDKDGNEIPCIKMVEKKEDFGIKDMKKRQWGDLWNDDTGSGGLGDLFGDKGSGLGGILDIFNNDDDSWWDWGNWWNKDKDAGNTRDPIDIWGNDNSWDDGGLWGNDNSWDDGGLWGNDNSWDDIDIWGNNIPPQGPNVPPQGPNVPPQGSNVPPQGPNNVPPEISSPIPQAPQTPQNPQSTQPSSKTSASLPIKDFTMTGFGKCNQKEAEILRGLIEDIKIYRAAAVYLLNNQSEDEMYNKIFLKYFKDNSVLSRVQRTFGNVNNMPTIAAYCEPASDTACSEGALAWTYLNSVEYHVCPSFFTEAMFGTIAQRASEGASIVLHEMTHCHGTEDYAYGEAGSGRLPASQASNNADTFRLFAMSSIYYLNEKGRGLFKRSDDFLNQNVDFRAEPFKDKVIIRPVMKKRSDEDFLNQNIDFRAEPFKDKVVERPSIKKRSDEDFLNQNIDFRAEPFKDKVVERPSMKKRSDEDFLNQNIDFRAEPFKDKVVERPNIKKRSDEDFLNQNIDFRAEPFKDKVVERPSIKKRSDEDFLNQNIDFRAEPFKDKVVERPSMKKRSDEDFLNQNIDFRAEPFKDKVVERPN